MVGFTTYNVTANASGGLYNMVNATNTYMDSVIPVLGANMVAMSILIPAWIIIYIPLSRYDAGAAFITASFVTWLLTSFLVFIQFANELLFILLTVLLALSALGYYITTRQ